MLAHLLIASVLFLSRNIANMSKNLDSTWQLGYSFTSVSLCPRIFTYRHRFGGSGKPKVYKLPNLSRAYSIFYSKNALCLCLLLLGDAKNAAKLGKVSVSDPMLKLEAGYRRESVV